eukprot:gene12289-13554_t
MESLVSTEQDLASALHRYLETEQKRLTVLKQFLERTESTLEQVNKTSAGKFVGNPINSYLMLKRFSVDWKNLEDLVTADYSEEVMSKIETARPRFPSSDDFHGAMDAIFRLQNTYHLVADKLADGVVPGIEKSTTLSMADIFELGRHAYERKDWFHTKGWMHACLKRLGRDLSKDGVTKFDVLDHLAIAEYNRGNLKRALRATKVMKKIDPSNARVDSNLEFYQYGLDSMQKTGKRGDTGSIQDVKKRIFKRRVSKKDEWIEKSGEMRYEKLCRGEVRKLTRLEKQKLVCWLDGSKPRRKIDPIRVERIWVTPEVVLFRSIINDEEANQIKSIALPKLNRATIQDPVTGELRVADYRISKSAWLKYNSHPLLMKIKHRVEDATGLTCDTAEDLQVANYGIGGHYEPHFDFAREDEDQFTELGTGNRIATVLFYISDVEAGGATVFTYAKAAVFPSKGDALFWFNLKKSGKGNYITRHAACPVLAGTKWVSNVWLHAKGQEFSRPCGLTEDE